jgi:DNA topoisomerase-1
VKRGDEFRSLANDEQVFAVTQAEALELFRQEKPSRQRTSRTVLRELGRDPGSGAVVQLLEGRYGPYVSDGTTNASLPKDLVPDQLNLDGAIALLKARQEAGNGRRQRSGASATRGRGGGSRRSAARKRRA